MTDLEFQTEPQATIDMALLESDVEEYINLFSHCFYQDAGAHRVTAIMNMGEKERGAVIQDLRETFAGHNEQRARMVL